MTLAFCAASGLSACADTAPKGQVAAVVNGEEVTTGELRAEAAARGLSDANDPALRSRLLRDVVNRKLWVQEARRNRLDQQIEFVLARRRAEEALLAGLLIRTIEDEVEPPSDSDVDRFLRENPSAFSSRTVFQIDQIDFRPDGDAIVTERLKGARSLDEAEKLLTGSGVVSQRSRTEWNSLFMPAPLVDKLRQASPGKPFVHQDGDRIVIGVVTARTDIPLSGRAREILARRSLAQKKVGAAVGKRLDGLRASARIDRQAGFASAEADR